MTACRKRCAPEDDPFRAGRDESSDDLLVATSRLLADDAAAQLLVDDAVHRLAVIRFGDEHAQVVLGQPVAVEVLLHGEAGGEQAHGTHAALFKGCGGDVGPGTRA